MNDSSTSQHKHQLIAEAFLPPPSWTGLPITDTDFLMFLPIPQADWSLRERTVHIFFVPTTVPGANGEGFIKVSLVNEDWIHKKKKKKALQFLWQLTAPTTVNSASFSLIILLQLSTWHRGGVQEYLLTGGINTFLKE